MKPCIYSRLEFEKSGKGWFRGGENIKYIQNDIPRKANSYHSNTTATGNLQNKPTSSSANPSGVLNSSVLLNNNGAGEGLEYYFTLSFEYDFPEEEDEVWFA